MVTPLYFDFTISGLSTMHSGKFDPTITIQFNDASTPSPLKQLSAHTAHKTLGTYKSPAGNENAAFQVITSKNVIHAKILARSPFNKIDAWTYYHAIYLPSISYPFPSSSFSTEQCRTLQVQIKKSLLLKCGYNRSTPNAVIYGHSDFAGIEIQTMAVNKVWLNFNL